MQSGNFEVWLFPVKVLSRFAITAKVAGYTSPVDLATRAATIEVTPASTTITYTDAAFIVREHIFAPREGELALGVVYEINAVRPLVLTFRFRPEMQWMWPVQNSGRPVAEWIQSRAIEYYLLHSDDRTFSAAVAMPRAHLGAIPLPGLSASKQELELRLTFDPQKDKGRVFPLMITGGEPSTDFARRLTEFKAKLPHAFAETERYWKHFFDTRLTIDTPNPKFDEAVRWAEVAIEQGRVQFHGENGLVAGYSQSGDSTRPGFGWFFGRDSLWTSFAINSYGDFKLTREVLEFLIRQQREDGKIMHEFSQTADLVNWRSMPYYYAAADSTPLFIMAVEDYVNASADKNFLRSHWDAVRRAYAFTRAHDSDGDGIYENTEGTGWVESWPPGMPHQEIYLAALDQQSANAMSHLASLMHEEALAAVARAQALKIRDAIQAGYFESDQSFYAFSRNSSGSIDHTASIFPAVAWWAGTTSLQNAEAMLDRWSSSELSTDWGIRDISTRTPFYDPLSYHQGSVWPLFTGWVSVAEYRAGRSVAGYTHMMQNASLTWAQDLGSITEVLSGQVFQPLPQSTPHQIWSSAMVITPAVRGLFGLDWDATHQILHVQPSLPASWSSARVRNVPLGNARVDLNLTRRAGRLLVRARSGRPVVICGSAGRSGQQQCDMHAARVHQLSLPLPAIELEIPYEEPSAGEKTRQLKVTRERRAARQYEIEFEALPGSHYDLPVQLNQVGVKTVGGELSGTQLRVQFPEGSGSQRCTVTFTW